MSSAMLRQYVVGGLLLGTIACDLPRDGAELSGTDVAVRTERTADDLCKVDWRLHGLTVMPVSHLEETAPPRL